MSSLGQKHENHRHSFIPPRSEIRIQEVPVGGKSFGNFMETFLNEDPRRYVKSFQVVYPKAEAADSVGLPSQDQTVTHHVPPLWVAAYLGLRCLDRLLMDLLRGIVLVSEELGKRAVLVDEQLQWDEVPRGQQRVMEDGLPTFTRDSRPDWGGYLEQHRIDTGGDKSDSDSQMTAGIPEAKNS
ncbi:hypothetical protein H0G86_010928 [Trichoderma simmonsii]|uniref:Uncharacterized protein n=1 Tax=Trichoderma simmonsii TaxID=1491479 RepID=A0A8G0LNB6_9HYPO|nr:hypothetical protein H0G86_010928 [Trichoderma simmonsii]